VLGLENVTTTPAAPVIVRMPGTGRRALVGAAASGALLVITIAFVASRTHGTTDDAGSAQTLAVLPFRSVGGDSAQEYFADGLTDEIATALGKVSGIQIAARSSAYRYKGIRDVDVRQVGHALGAGYIVQGTVRREGDSVRVATQVTRSADKKEVWEETKTGDARNVFALEDAMIKSIKTGLASRLGLSASGASFAAAPQGAGNQGTSDAEAHNAYMRARFFVLTRRSVAEAANLFQKAIDNDSNYARAYAGLAETLEYLPYYNGAAAADLRPRVEAAAKRALALDSTQAEAHVGLAMMHAHAWEWDAAGDEFRRALALDANDVSAHTQYARYLIAVGRPQDALTELRAAANLDPVSGIAPAWMIDAQLALGRIDEALAQSKATYEIDSTLLPSIELSGLAYAAAKRYDESLRRERRFRSSAPPFPANLAFVFGQTGMRDSALAMARDFEARPRTGSSEIVIALAYLGLKDTARALDALERSTDLRGIWPSFQPLCSFQYDQLRSSPRFAALVRRVGLDETKFTSPQACRVAP
jgi:serine/threonine-protein kinase